MISIATPEVTRIAETALTTHPGYEEYYVLEELMDLDIVSAEAEDVMEFAGRGCYQSFHKPNPATERNADYLRNIIRQQHESVLEHATVTFYATGISRALTHELVRHRMFNYSQQSQRFVNEEEARIVLPPAVASDSPMAGEIRQEVEAALETYKNIVTYLQEEGGLPRKQAREAARAVLPNCTETRITFTANHRAMRQFLWRRLDPSADAEIRGFAQLILDDLYADFSAIYEDIKEHFEEVGNR